MDKSPERAKRWGMNLKLLERIRVRMFDMRIANHELSRRCQIERSRIGHWLKGSVTLSEDEFTRLMTSLNLCE